MLENYIIRIDEQVYIEKLGKEFSTSTSKTIMNNSETTAFLLKQIMESRYVCLDNDFDNELYFAEFIEKVKEEANKKTLNHKYTFNTGNDKDRKLSFFKEITITKA